jgi:hypothetical protein
MAAAIPMQRLAVVDQPDVRFMHQRVRRF